MKAINKIIWLLMVALTPSSLCPHSSFVQPKAACSPNPVWEQDINTITYDQIISFLHEIESGELDNICSEEQVDQISQFLAFLAQEGVMPGDAEGSALLAEDIYTLLGEEPAALYDCDQEGYSCAFTICQSNYSVIQCGWIKKKFKKIKNFVKKHKKAIITGAVVVLVVAGVTVGIAMLDDTGSPSPSDGASTALGKTNAPEKPPEPTSSEERREAQEAQRTQRVPISHSSIPRLGEEAHMLKENMVRENYFGTLSSDAYSELSLQETGRILGNLFGHDSLGHLQKYMPAMQDRSGLSYLLPDNSPGALAHKEIDRRFPNIYDSPLTNKNLPADQNALIYQLKGQTANSFGHYHQAVIDFGKSISIESSPASYLHRGLSYFNLGHYKESIKDFQEFKAQARNAPEVAPLSLSDFAIGFGKGAREGIYESGKGMLLFVSGLIGVPIHTATQIHEAFSKLAELIKDEEWKSVGEALSPETLSLAEEWEMLPLEERGRLAGYVFGKHTTDILGREAETKGIKRELFAISTRFKNAEDMLLLETVAELNNAVSLSEIVSAGKTTLFLGEELGFTVEEMGSLKREGKLESLIVEKYNHLSRPMQESIVTYKKAQEVLQQYAKKPMPESEVRELIHKNGVPTFPRPKGIPENYVVMISDKGVGMEYVHPVNMYIRVSVMPGKPHSPNPDQQKPYVIQQENGKAFDKEGNLLEMSSPKVHIPLEDFFYKRSRGGATKI